MPRGVRISAEQRKANAAKNKAKAGFKMRDYQYAIKKLDARYAKKK